MTTRRLLLLRHAKSSWDQPGLADVDRPLAPRGRRAAPLVAAHMKRHGWIPDLVMCSHAERVQQTWALVAPVLGPAIESRTLRTLYLGGPARLLDTIRRADAEVRCLMLIGHNPGFAGLAVRLCGAGPGGALARMRAKFPTAALAVIAFDGDDWAETAEGRGRLEAFVRPKELA